MIFVHLLHAWSVNIIFDYFPEVNEWIMFNFDAILRKFSGVHMFALSFVNLYCKMYVFYDVLYDTVVITKPVITDWLTD